MVYEVQCIHYMVYEVFIISTDDVISKRSERNKVLAFHYETPDILRNLKLTLPRGVLFFSSSEH